MADRLDRTLLGVCVKRAVVAHANREVAAGRDPSKPATRRETMKGIRVGTQDGSKLAALVLTWALALEDLQADAIGAETFVAWTAESRATVYRRLAEFREAFPEYGKYGTPNELAAQVLADARRRGSKPTLTTLLIA